MFLIVWCKFNVKICKLFFTYPIIWIEVNDAGKNDIIIKLINKEITTRSIILNKKLSTNNIKYILRDEFKELTHFIDDFIKGKELNRYFIIPGLRGVGKTTILFQIYEYLLKEKNIPQNQILYLSCENLNERFKFKILDVVECFLKYHHNSLLETVDKKIFLLIDESQYDYNWALSGKSIYDATNNIFMIFTGSAALDFEYNADSARRLLKRTINPLTYNQYLKLKYNFNANKMSEALCEVIFDGKVDNAINVEKTFIPELYSIGCYLDDDLDKFIFYGVFPISFFEEDMDIVCERLNNVIRRVITKDILRFGKISTDNLENAHRLLNFRECCFCMGIS